MSNRGRRVANNDETINSNTHHNDYKNFDEDEKYLGNNTKSKAKKKHKGLKIFVIIILILAILIGVAYAFVNDKLGKMNQESIDTTQVGIDSNVADSLKDYRNIALLGIDSREDDYSLGNRSDCIIIASINNKTNDINLFSVYRDTYVNVLENNTEKLDKITHAYSYGGAQNTLKSLNEALDLNITEYVTVNFDAVIAAIDELDGVNINIDSDELKYINDYIDATSQSSGTASNHITKTGMQTLNGVQAVAYSRIRYTSGGDYKRTERMRTVVTAMATKAKSLSFSQLNTFANNILPKISTNISSSTMISMIPSLASFNINKSIGWPYTTKGITLDRWYGVPCTLETNVVKLHQEAFDQNDYTASNTVKAMSDAIIKKTGYIAE